MNRLIVAAALLLAAAPVAAVIEIEIRGSAAELRTGAPNDGVADWVAPQRKIVTDGRARWIAPRTAEVNDE